MSSQPDNHWHTRRRLLETSLRLLTERGDLKGILKDAAHLIDCPLERAQIFFKRDAEIVLALYLRLATDLESRIQELPSGTIAQRFQKFMQLKFELARPYRVAFQALFQTARDATHELGVLSDKTEFIRHQVIGMISALVAGATDQPTTSPGLLVHTLYGVHLTLMMLWAADRSPREQLTKGILSLVVKIIKRSKGVLNFTRLNPLFERIDRLIGAYVEPPPHDEDTQLARAILTQIFQHRRLHSLEDCSKNPCEQCFALHLVRVRRAIMMQEPIHAILPAFPAKSPSLKKVLGVYPDMAEEIALNYLQSLATAVQAIYPPGMQITICSDGRVFSDLVGVTDDQVTNYGIEIQAMIKRLGVTALATFNTEDVFETTEYSVMRTQLCEHYAESLATIQHRVRTIPQHTLLFNGIQRFMFEDQLGLEPSISRTQLRKQCKELTYQVIQRSNAWTRLLTECFPTALRLSIHPQDPHSDKIGILLGQTNDTWLTPWHSVAVASQGHFILQHRQAVEAQGARLVERFGRPSHFEL